MSTRKASAIIPGLLIYAKYFCIALSLAAPHARAQSTSESAEIIYSGDVAQLLRTQADQLNSAAEIYEFSLNNFEYAVYHGSRSGSVNTLLGKRGNDVDIASAVIAMMRNKGIPARYAVGNIRVPAGQLSNWVGVTSLDAALYLLKVQGTQGVTTSADKKWVELEHVWVEAFVPYDQYRGINAASPAIDCSQSANFSRCTWVALDASFKQKKHNDLELNPHDAVEFNYTAYYDALKNNDPSRRDKNPIQILEEQLSAWLRGNHPGKTLEDIEDAGQIIPIHEGLLPASLPYEILGAVRRYDTIAQHDAVPSESKKWGKKVSVVATMTVPASGGGTQTVNLGTATVLLSDLGIKRLTLSVDLQPSGGDWVPALFAKLDGQNITDQSSISPPVAGYTPALYDRFDLQLRMDGAPSVISDSGPEIIERNEAGMIGGYYVVVAGGEQCNPTQYVRAADRLLASSKQYKIVFNPSEASCTPSSGMGCTPYLDINSNGWDSSDRKMIESISASEDLTGGMLHVAASLYCSDFRRLNERVDRLMKAKTPLIGLLGLASSVYEVEYVNGTAFSVLPGGLLINVGHRTPGSFRTNASPLAFSNKQFELAVHGFSSLEHEVWQRLTGYDAISTVRGFQMARANGATMLNPKNNPSTNSVSGFISAMGFGNTAPAPFLLKTRSIFNTTPNSWAHSSVSGEDGFDLLKKSPAGISDPQRASFAYWNDAWDEIVACYDDVENTLNSLKATYGGGAKLTGGSLCYDPVLGAVTQIPAQTTIDQAINALQQGYANLRATYSYRFNLLDGSQGFSLNNFGMRNTSFADNLYTTESVEGFRDDMLLRDTAQGWVEYVMPSTLATGCQYRFEVSIRKYYSTASASLDQLTFSIANRGGGSPSACN